MPSSSSSTDAFFADLESRIDRLRLLYAREFEKLRKDTERRMTDVANLRNKNV